MRSLLAITLLSGALLVRPDRSAARPPDKLPLPRRPHASTVELNAVVQQYCQKCHNPTSRRGNLSLSTFDVGNAPEQTEVAEKIVAKLRSGMMPPVGSARPSADTVNALVVALERQLDSSAIAHPNPGGRSFQRLNRAEYRTSVKELLGLTVDAGVYLPQDTKSDNFDNIADVQALSPTLLDGYLRAASDISCSRSATPMPHPRRTRTPCPRWRRNWSTWMAHRSAPAVASPWNICFRPTVTIDLT